MICHFLVFSNVYADNCSGEFNNDSSDEFMSKLKSTNSSFCLLRHSRNIAQPLRSSERNSSAASSLTYNFGSNSSAIQEKSTDSTTLTTSSSSRSKMVSRLHLLLDLFIFIFHLGAESPKVADFQSATRIIDNARSDHSKLRLTIAESFIHIIVTGTQPERLVPLH